MNVKTTWHLWKICKSRYRGSLMYFIQKKENCCCTKYLKHLSGFEEAGTVYSGTHFDGSFWFTAAEQRPWRHHLDDCGRQEDSLLPLPSQLGPVVCQSGLQGKILWKTGHHHTQGRNYTKNCSFNDFNWSPTVTMCGGSDLSIIYIFLYWSFL